MASSPGKKARRRARKAIRKAQEVFLDAVLHHKPEVFDAMMASLAQRHGRTTTVVGRGALKGITLWQLVSSLLTERPLGWSGAAQAAVRRASGEFARPQALSGHASRPAICMPVASRV